MPEGDAVWLTARRLHAALAGRVLIRSDFRVPRFATADLSSLRLAVVGGAPMPEALLQNWHERGVAVVQGYGLTEAAPNVLCLPPEDAMRKIGSAGKP